MANPTEAYAVAVKKVVVQLGKKELILDIEEAKQLNSVLNELFNIKPTVVVTEQIVKEHHYHDRPFYWYHNSPIYGTNGYGYKYNDNVVYCSTGNSGFESKLTLVDGTGAQEVK